MKTLMIIASLLMSGVASADYYAGDKIEFQAESAFVSAVLSKSLCLDGDTYRATITKCGEWKESNGGETTTCVKYVKVEGAQPVVSTRQRCAQYESDSSGGDCIAWETVPYVQKPTRNVQLIQDSNTGADKVIKTFSVTVPACN